MKSKLEKTNGIAKTELKKEKVTTQGWTYNESGYIKNNINDK